MEKNNNIEFCITVDFEDFSHDLARSLGIELDGKSREWALATSYDKFNKFLSDNFKNTKSTFFCTGIVAHHNPHIVKRISAEGHEIACHNYFHDNLFNEAPDLIYRNLKKAKDLLEDLTGNKVEGFRAPRFSISKFDIDRLKTIARLFSYDSSLHFSSSNELNSWKQQFNLDIYEFPVASQKFGLNLFKTKLGGSYYKLFPISIVLNSVTKTIENGLLPVIYLHPYDILNEPEFLLSKKELKELPSSRKYYWLFRQKQWCSFFNKQIDKKLMSIAQFGNHIGTLGEQLCQK